MAAGSTSRCSRPMPPRSSSACSTRRAGARPTRVALPEFTDEVWHGYLPDVRPGPALRLPRPRPLRPAERPPLQPAQAADRPLRQGAPRRHQLARLPVRLPRRLAARRPACPTGATSAFVMPKCVVVDTAATWGRDRSATTPWADTIIYEAHVKGMTALREDMPERDARHLRRPSPTRGSSTTWSSSASPRSS